MVLTGRAVCHGRMMAKTNTVLDFTCFEMQDRTQAWWAFSRPQGLVADAGMAARDAGIMDLLADTCHSTASHRLVVAQCSCCRVAGALRAFRLWRHLVALCSLLRELDCAGKCAQALAHACAVLCLRSCTINAGIEFAGENALHCWESESAIDQIETACEQATAQGVRMAGFTALRLEPYLVIPGSPQKAALARFVANMKNLPARRGSRSMMEKLSIAFDRAYYTYKAATC